MQEVRIRVEHIHTIRMVPWGLPVPQMQTKVKRFKGRSRSQKQSIKGRTYWMRRMGRSVPAVVSTIAALAMYAGLACLAFEERGHFAIGGEAMLPVVAGFLLYQIIK